MRNLRMVFCMLIGLLIGSVVGIVIVNVSHNQQKKRHAQHVTTEMTATADTPMEEAATATDTEAHTSGDADRIEAVTIPDEEQPETLTEILDRSLVDYAQLAEVSCRQLIVVDAEQAEAAISMYVCDEDGQWRDAGLTTTGYVGENGVSRESYEGSRMTPAGVFPVGEAFYIEEKPETGLDTFQITENTYWVDDVDSELYNQRVELDGEKQWQSAEHMIEYTDAYRYGFVVEYNQNPIEPGRGSAIFFHVGSRPTLGCVAASEDMVLAYLAQLSKDMHPYIVIQ